MANKTLKQKALEMRKKNMSYSQIKADLGTSKSTLSGWLKDMPLSKERIHELGAHSEKRIERYRNTMFKKAEEKRKVAYEAVSAKLGELSDREKFIAGLFLYWAEGSKAKSADVNLTNTNPQMLIFFIEWLKLLGVRKEDMKVTIILYSDMDIEKELMFWERTLGLPRSQFYKPRIKESKFSSITYKNGFGHGTCAIRYGSKPLTDFVLMGIKRLEDIAFEQEYQLLTV